MQTKNLLHFEQMCEQLTMQQDKLENQKSKLETRLREQELDLLRLRESEARFRKIIEELPAGIIECDNNYEITYLNPAAGDLLGCSDKINYGIKKIFDIINQDSIMRLLSGIKNLEQKGTSGLLDMRIKTGSEENFNYIAQVNLVEAHGRRIGYRFMVLKVEPNLNITFIPEHSFFLHYGISKREKEVFIHILRGFKTRNICDMLSISESTVKKHTTSIFRKLACRKRSQLIELVHKYQDTFTSLPPVMD